MGIPEFVSVELDYVECCQSDCDALIVMPRRAIEKLRRSHEWFYCYRGHNQHFPQKSDVEKLKADLQRERKRREWTEREVAAERERSEKLERSRNAYKGKLTSTKKRIKHGVCPCCKRSFKNLQRHMESQHPRYAEANDV